MEWGKLRLDVPVPVGTEVVLAAAAEHVTLLHVVAAGALYLLLRNLMQRSVPSVALSFEDEAEEKDVIEGRTKLDPRKVSPKDAPAGFMRCWDPCTMQDLGNVKAYTPAEVHDAMARARAAQAKWKLSTFTQRRHFLNVLSRCITENMDAIVRVACRDSGKVAILETACVYILIIHDLLCVAS